MSRDNRRNGEASGGKNKKHRKNKHKPNNNSIPKNELRRMRKENIFRGPKPDRVTNKIETHDPTRPFTLAACQKCGITEWDDKSTCTDHEPPIVIGVSGQGMMPAASGIFCNVDSKLNSSFLLHSDKLNRCERDLLGFLAALNKVKSYITSRGETDDTQSKRITQIIIKHDGVTKGFTGRSRDKRYENLALQFDNLVDELGELNGVPTVVKFWKIRNKTMAQRLAESALEDWEEAKVQVKSTAEMGAQE
jgi:hypothetical protein